MLFGLFVIFIPIAFKIRIRSKSDFRVSSLSSVPKITPTASKYTDSDCKLQVGKLLKKRGVACSRRPISACRTQVDMRSIVSSTWQHRVDGRESRVDYGSNPEV